MIKPWLRTLDRRITKGRLFLLRHGIVGRQYRALQRMNRNPIFIGGCGRSGTSLLLSLLSVLPEVYSIPHETKAFSSETEVSKCRIDFIYSHLTKPEVTIETYDRWCEKTPKNIQAVPRILKYFGEGARFVHIVRDGRDVVTSRHPRSPDRYWVPPERWVRDVRAGRVVEDHPQVATIRYEDLTTEPLSELRKLCDFLNEPFDEDRFRAYPESAQFGTGDFFSKAVSDTEAPSKENKGLHTRSQKRWQKNEHTKVVNQLLALEEARELLCHYGFVESA